MFSLTVTCLLGVGMEWLAASLVCRPRLYGLLRLGRSGLLRSLRQYVPGKMPRTSRHRSPGGERRRKRKRFTIFLERTMQRRPSSFGPTLELFLRQRCGNFRETGWSAYTVSPTYRYHLELKTIVSLVAPLFLAASEIPVSIDPIDSGTGSNTYFHPSRSGVGCKTEMPDVARYNPE